MDFTHYGLRLSTHTKSSALCLYLDQLSVKAHAAYLKWLMLRICCNTYRLFSSHSCLAGVVAQELLEWDESCLCRQAVYNPGFNPHSLTDVHLPRRELVWHRSVSDSLREPHIHTPWKTPYLHTINYSCYIRRIYPVRLIQFFFNKKHIHKQGEKNKYTQFKTCLDLFWKGIHFLSLSG